MGGNICSVFNDTGEPLGIYRAEGMEGRSGSFLQQWFHRQPQTALVVICRGDRTRQDEMTAQAAGEQVVRLLTAFERWFCHDFASNLHPFSVDVVKRYWQSMIGQVSETGRQPFEVAALLVHAGQYVFCSRGHFSVYEYTISGQKCRRWYTDAVRRRLDEELGISQEDISGLQFRHRNIREKTLFLLYLKDICLKDIYPGDTYPQDIHSLDFQLSKLFYKNIISKRILPRRRIIRGLEQLAEHVCCAAAVTADAAGGRRR